MVPKKSPKSPKIPKLSIKKPKNDHFIKISAIPIPKHTVPLILVGLVKNVTVLWGPIIKMIPITKRIFPNANNPESKNVITPNMKSITPNVVKPTPYSASLLVFLPYLVVLCPTYSVCHLAKSLFC